MQRNVLTESQNFAGSWFIPNEASDTEPSQEIPGVLHWKDGDARLVLNAAFPDALQGHSNSYLTVFGTTRIAELVSIHAAVEVRSNLAFGPAGEVQTQELSSHTVIVGAHVDATQLYEEITFRIPGLEVWLGGSVARETQTDTAVTIELPAIQDEVIELPGHDLTLRFRVGRTSNERTHSQLHYSFPGYLTLCPKAPATLQQLINQFSKVTTFLSTMIASPVFPDWISAKLPGDDPASRVNVLVGLNHAELCRHTSWRDFFMTRQRLGDNLARVLTAWFDGYEGIASTNALAQAVLNSTGLWPHVQFLSHMQVLEGLHRVRHVGLYMDKDNYKKLAGDLAGCIPVGISDGHRASLKARIHYGNEISLRNRLKALVSELPPDIRHLVLNADALPSSWVDTRNYYTHWDNASKDSIVDGLEMHAANLRLGMLIRVLLLRVAAVPDEAIINALRGASKEAQRLQQAAMWARHGQLAD